MNKPIQNADRTRDLIRRATAARENAYAPYSKFKVGAAVLTSSGRVYTGCNVENVSYGLTACAERVAIGKAVSEGEREIAALAVVIESEPAFPCGACLQVIQEFAREESPDIIAANTEGKYYVRTLSECLPHAFREFKSEGNQD